MFRRCCCSALSVAIFLRDVIGEGRFASRSTYPASPKHLSSSFTGSAIVHFVAALIASAVLLVRTWITAKSAVVRQQVKWVVWGTLLAVAPFTLLYGVGLLVWRTDRSLVN